MDKLSAVHRSLEEFSGQGPQFFEDAHIDTLLSITLDNGGEFYRHDKLPVPAYFCDPHSPWQRGSIENANGVLRRSLPRKTNINQWSENDLIDIMWTYNTTPRKCLGYLTPLEAFAKDQGVALEI